MEPRGKTTPHVTAYYKAMAVISAIRVMLINLVYAVTAIKDGGWPHMNLISHVGARARVTTALGDTETRRGTSANQGQGNSHTHIMNTENTPTSLLLYSSLRKFP